MGWLDQPKEVRAARKVRRAARRRRQQANTDRQWTEKERAARDGRDKAAVEYDYARACIADAPADQQAGLYEDLRKALEQFNQKKGWRT